MAERRGREAGPAGYAGATPPMIHVCACCVCMHMCAYVRVCMCVYACDKERLVILLAWCECASSCRVSPSCRYD